MSKMKYYFGVVDYILFAALLFLSAMTGVYFGFRHKLYKKRKREDLKDYLTANRNLKPFPVAMSLIASYVSGVTMLGTPAEIYNFGAQYWIIVVAMTASGAVVAFIYLPVFTKLRVSSSYEYLELRFSRHLRTIASIFFLIDEILFLPTLIYIPSLAFSQVSGIDHHLIGIIACAVCVFYTILGGLRAVVYTDTWQTAIMFVADVVIVIHGVVAVGGFKPIIDIGLEGNRIQAIDFYPSMYTRYNIYVMWIGGFMYWTAFNSVNQTMVQRYLSLPNDKQAKCSVALFTFGVVFFISMCCFAGLLVYTYYHDCDPLTSERIATSDQILPLFVVESAGHLSGMPGLFVAGVFGAGLSSLSVVLNSSSVVILEDLLQGAFRIEIKEERARLISKFIVLGVGIVAYSMVFVIEQLGGIFQVATTLTAINAGTMFGLFSLGMLIPFTNTKGAIVGSISGYIMACIVAFGSNYATTTGLVVAHKLPVSVDGCLEKYDINITSVKEIEYPDESGVFPLFRLAFFWVTPIGFFTVVIVGVITSLITGKTDVKTVDPELISPICQRFLPEEAKNYAGTAVKKIEHKRLLDRIHQSASSVRLSRQPSEARRPR
ncbi:sodium-coupled monocarboxylate transporter 2-like isoform X2 [Zophobas morio]|uniref:sodium-coupled monocarboxylate transporter 2-like isoform X2 n=1 Tax=Zophobas morio TaxID=2755281 RepID=UPI0030836581